MNRKRYKEVLRVCCLEKDMEIMEHGDQTEIGERGINLSGGQKQRIQLARAVYQDCDIYLLDDVFSAVDAETGSEIFKECVRGALKDKTVLLVTHQVDFLHNADLIMIKLADKQAALERLLWEAMTSSTQVEKLQENVNTMQAQMSSFTLLCEGLRKNDAALPTEDDDATLYHSDHVTDIDYLDEMEMQKMEKAQEAYIAAAKENQDEESIAVARSDIFSRLCLRTTSMSTGRIVVMLHVQDLLVRNFFTSSLSCSNGILRIALLPCVAAL